ncbi:MAG: sulfur carrier protein ThiS [Acidimicrobiales bacterium]
MHVTVNGDALALPEGLSVAALLDHLGHERRGLAVAVNEEVVPRSTWDEALLAAGDRVELLQAVRGG